LREVEALKQQLRDATEPSRSGSAA